MYLILSLGSQALDSVDAVNVLNNLPLTWLNNITGIDDLEVVDVQAEHVGAVEVTDSDVAGLSLVVAKVGCNLLVSSTRNALRNELNIRCEVGALAGRNIYCIVLGSIAWILTTNLERQCATQVKCWRNQPVVGSESTAHVASRSHARSIKNGSVAGVVDSFIGSEGVPSIAVAIGIDGDPAALGWELTACEAIFEAFLIAGIDAGGAVAQVVSILAALPICIGSGSGDVVYKQVGRHCVSAQGGEVHALGPA